MRSRERDPEDGEVVVGVVQVLFLSSVEKSFFFEVTLAAPPLPHLRTLLSQHHLHVADICCLC